MSEPDESLSSRDDPDRIMSKGEGYSDTVTTHDQRQLVPQDTDVNEADLTATTSEAAASIDNKEMQLILRVSSLPSKSTKEYITAYFQLQGENINVTSVELVENGTAIVNLVDITDEEREQLLKKRHKMNKKQVEVEEVLPSQIEVDLPEMVPQPDSTQSPSSNILLVSNLPENADEHLIEMYFESPKSGGCDGAVESIDFVEPKVVRITLTNSQVTSSILEKNVHKLQGTELQVKCWLPSVEESSMSDTLEVSDLPQSCSEELLELYFENPKYGGCSGGVKAIKIIRPGVAQVTFDNVSIAANVVAKKEHKLKGVKLQVKYSCQDECSPSTVDDVLEITNLPHDIHEDTLELYLENSKSGGSCGAVKEITVVAPGMARVKVSSASIAANILAKEGHKLRGNELQMTLYTPGPANIKADIVADTVEVSSLPDNITEDTLELYFENRKSGGHEGAVKKISMIGPKEARVQFSSPETADVVLRKMHKIEGVNLQVKLFCEESLPSTHASIKDTLEVSGFPDGVSEEVLVLYFENAKSGGCADAVKEVFFPRPGVAQIQFISDTIAANVMAVKDHKLQRASLKIEYMCHNHQEAGFDCDEIQDTLEVSNLPSDVSEDILELYFDNPRSGGCEGAVKAVSLIGKGVAKVQFSSAKIAEVVAKKVHNFKGVQLELKYSKCAHSESSKATFDDTTLEVSNLPENTSKEYLEYYFESPKSGGCENAVKEITLVQPGVAKVLFSSPKIAADVLAKEVHRFKGADLHVQCIKTLHDLESESNVVAIRDTLEVSNLPSDITKDYLQYYFESPKSGGCTDCVKDITMVKDGVAHVQFTDASSAANVFTKKMHQLRKAELQVKYLPATLPTVYEMDKLLLQDLPEIEDDFLHLFIARCLSLSDEEFSVTHTKNKALLVFSQEYSINELQKMLNKLQAKPLKQRPVSAVLYEECKSIQIQNITKHYEEEFLHMYFESSKSGGGPVEAIHMLGEGQVLVFFKDPKVVSTVLGQSHPTLGPHIKIGRNDPLHSPTESSENVSSVDIKFDPIIVKCLNKHPEPLLELEAIKDLQIELKFDDSDGKIVCSSTRCTKAEWKKTATRSIHSYVDSHYTTLSNHSVPKDALQELYGHLSNVKGVQFVLSDDGRYLKLGGEKKVVDNLSKILKDIIDRYTVDKINQKFDPINFQFLVQVKLPQMKSDLHQLQITEDPLTHSLTIHGTKKEIAKFTETLSTLCKHCQVKVEVHAHISGYLRTDDGQMQLRSVLQRENTQAAIYITSKKQLIFLCDPAQSDSVKRVVTSLEKIVSVSERKVPSSFDNKQENYLQLCQTYEKQHHVQVSHSTYALVVAGMKSGVEVAAPKLYDFILESCTIEDCIIVERGEYRLLLSHMKDKWKIIEQKCESSAFAVTLSIPKLQHHDVDPMSKILIRGEKDCVKNVSREISKLKNCICKRSKAIKQADTTFFSSENARTYLDGIEFREHVTVEVVLPESNPSVPHTVSRTCYLKCTAKLTQRVLAYVYIGDICDFDADVIVNAANCELKHVGGVAQALLKKGGPIINEESTRFIKKHGKLNTGDAWLTTKVGNLPCKALVHTVGPIWSTSGDHEKDTRLLESACIQSLLQSSQGQKYQSIAFPAISSGVYRFPIDKCAQCMVKAMIKFTNSDTTSQLNNIHFVIHHSNSDYVKYFTSALEHNLPAGSVTINNEQMNRPKLEIASRLPMTSNELLIEKKSASKKSSSMSKRPAIHQAIPPGVLDCIKLTKGSLLDVQADVYVNTTNNQLNLSSGAVSIALLKAGGKSLQDDCTKKGPIKTGDVAVTGPGQIPCKHIFHTVIPSYDGKSSEKVLKNSLNKCFKECASRNMISIAIPSIGTGNLRFPKEVVAKITVEEAISFLSTKKRCSLEFVHLVIFMEDVYRAFQAVLSGYGSQGEAMLSVNREDNDDSDDAMLLSPSVSQGKVRKSRLVGTSSINLPSTSSDKSKKQKFCIYNLKVELISGDITESICNVIVNPTNSKMNLSGAGVAGAILSIGGQEQQDLCDAVISGIDTLNDDRVVHTKATGKLQCKFIFHINYDGRDVKKLSKIILMCLNKGEEMKITSMAFPAIGAGTNSCSPQESAAGMLQAIRTFASSSPSKLHQINVVVCEPSVLQAFTYAFQHPEEAQTGIFQKALNYLSSFVRASNSSADPKVVPVMEELSIGEPVEVKIYGETESAVNKAHHKIGCWLDEKLSDRTMHNKYIQSLIETDEEDLRKICKDLHVEIEIDRDSSSIHIKGERESVEKVHHALTESLHQHEKKIDKMEHAKQLYDTVRWKRMDSDDGEEYDLIINYEIEMAKRMGKGSYTVGTKDDTEYFTVDFTTGKETDHHSSVICSVTRIDVLKELQERLQGEKPPTWDKMPPNSSLYVVKLDTKSKEYDNVLQRFDQTMKGKYKGINKIERIQNPALYLQYIGRQKQMDRQNPPGHQNERLLFHGTAAETCPKVNQNGFNRSFAGKNATVYGQGVYFARDASYSARENYSPRDTHGYKYIYLAKALTGEFIKGNSSMIVPPHKDAAKFIEYDSVVDAVANPSIFVIFYDALVYPDYLITFE